MTFTLYCIVNAAGVPYQTTFRDTERSAIYERVQAHTMRRPDARGFIVHGATEIEDTWAELQKTGDRLVLAQIETNETVKVDFKPGMVCPTCLGERKVVVRANGQPIGMEKCPDCWGAGITNL